MFSPMPFAASLRQCIATVCNATFITSGDGSASNLPLCRRSIQQRLADHSTVVTQDTANSSDRQPSLPPPADQDSVTLWKDADPNIPILKQAKTEYAKLN